LLVLLPALVAAGGGAENALAPDEAAERDLVERINQSREEQGLARLETNDRLREAARAHAREMAARRQLAHRFAEEPELRLRVAATGLRFDFVGENVGRGNDMAVLHQEFLLSPGHRENILEAKANAVGIGVVRAGDELYVAENFARVIPDYTPQQVEDLVARSIAEMRQQAKLGRLSRGSPEALREDACRMARRDHVEFTPADAPPGGTLRTLAWATADPQQVPDTLRDLVLRSRPSSFSLGACSGRTPSYPSGAYWIVVVFYF
jgi:hypothetical protein